MFHTAGDPLHPHDLDDVPTERLEAEIQTLAGHLAAASCAFLVLIGEFDRRGAHEPWECLSTAHWLNWKCGTGMTAAREQVRVARRLPDMPVVLAAFSRGQLSYSKVRAISRVCHSGIEDGLVSLAQHATAHQLEQACSALRRCNDLAEEEARLRAGEDDARRRARLTLDRTDTGALTGRFLLSPDDAEIVTRALATAVGDLNEGPHPAAGGHEPIERQRARALVAMASAYLADPHTGPGPQPELIIHIDATALTPEPTDPPTGSTSATAATTANTTADTTGDSAESSPTGIRPIAHARWPLHLGSGTAVSVALLARLASDTGLRWVTDLPDGTQLNLGRHQRLPDAALRRALMARDIHCRFPGCQSRRRLHAHHIIWWILGGPTNLDNLLMLCPKHHHAIHDRHWNLTGTSTNPTFTRPDGHRVEGRADPVHGDTADLMAAHHDHGLDIAVDHAGGHWQGDHIDWDCFFAGFANPQLREAA